MTPFFQQDGVTIFQGDCRAVLAGLPAGSAHTCITSPPYLGLRAYGTHPVVWGGDLNCPHDFIYTTVPAGGKRRDVKHGVFQATRGTQPARQGAELRGTRATCSRCGAWLGELGLEETPAQYVAHLVEIFRGVRRVLADHGTLWIVIGDTYSAGGRKGRQPAQSIHGGEDRDQPGHRVSGGRPGKNLLGIPWRLAFALQDDGWVLRSDIIWAKGNPTPESVKDRPTKSHEHVFLLTKQARYYYDGDAIAETAEDGSRCNKRDVWTVRPEQFRDEHFAIFPRRLITPCVLAGTSPAGACPKCGMQWKRIVRKGAPNRAQQQRCGADAGGGYRGAATKDYAAARAQDPSAMKARILAGMRLREEAGWRPACRCGVLPVPSVVLDPFTGSGTAALVSRYQGRRFVGAELNTKYCRLAKNRLAQSVLQLDADLGVAA